MIEYVDIFGPGSQAMFNDPSHQLWICVGSTLRNRIPADIGLDNHFLSPLNISLHPSHALYGTVKHGTGFSALDSRQVKVLYSRIFSPKLVIGTHGHGRSGSNPGTDAPSYKFSSFHPYNDLIICSITEPIQACAPLS